MATYKGKLKKGLLLGGKPQRNFEMKTPTAGDVIEAQEAAEKPVLTPDGYQMVSSPALMGVELLRRQIVKVGDFDGPLEVFQVKLLSSVDLDILNVGAGKLERAAFAKVAQRGRDGSGSKEIKGRVTAPEFSDPLDETRPLPDSDV